MGSKPIKILGTFQRNLQFNDYQAILQTKGRTDQKISFDNTMLWETVGLGVRVANQINRKSRAFLDLLYTFSKEQNNYGSSNALIGAPFSQHGISVNYRKNNRQLNEYFLLLIFLIFY
jgi:hypothetical protein